jgi:heat shock protein HslJ
MTKSACVALALIACLASLIHRQADARETVETVIERARADCHAFENGAFGMKDGTVTRSDLTGDGAPEAIVDAHGFTCSTAAALYCGTGGCPVTVVVDGSATAFLAKGWTIVQWGQDRILLMQVHGSRCGGTNLRRCFEAAVWSDGGFRSVDYGDAPGLAGSEWQPVELGGKPVPPQPEAPEQFVRFGAEGKLAGNAGCNRFFGSYGTVGNTLDIGPMGATRMACPEPVMKWEGRFMKALQAARRYRRDRTELILLDANGKAVARLLQRDFD